MKVISRNYIDRSSPYKWLVRNPEDSKEKAVACKAVKATGIEFKPSNESESGFGCKIVAWAQEAEIIEPETPAPVLTELNFTGYGFKGPDDKYVGSAKAIELTPEGKVLAVL